MTQKRLQEIIDIAHSDRTNPMSNPLIEMIDAYIKIVSELRTLKGVISESIQ